MSNVYFKKFSQKKPSPAEVQAITRELLSRVIADENITLEKIVPLKVHFGEKGNETFVGAENYNGIIDFLKNKNVEPLFIETNVLYNGFRHKKDIHLQTAAAHGFTQLPIVIADGDTGENYTDVPVNLKNCKTCKLGKEFDKYSQLLVLAHFKGHALAGFGGAIKQLAMGFAARGGKMDMHTGLKPRIINRKCKKCNLCLTRCKENAITIAEKSFIDENKCVGCCACVAICPHKAITLISFKALLRFFGIGNNFHEKLAEYAYAAHHGRRNIYLNFSMNITAGCDCDPRKMKPLMDDIGVYASTDPVAIDKACFDAVRQNGKKFRGEKIFAYAQKIGLGSPAYNLISL